MRGTLTRERIAAKALELIDDNGLEGLNMRDLGKALGCEAMALYYHFRNKGVLLDAVAELLLSEMVAPGPEAGTPEERLRLSLRSYRDVAVNHPRAFPLLTSRRAATPESMAFYDKVLAIYFDAGFDAGMAARLFRLGGYYVGGAGHAEIASRAKAPDPTPVVMESLREPGSFPNLTAVAPHLKLSNLDSIFDFGLEAVIAATMKAPKKLPG